MSQVKNPPDGMARINPYLFYQDVKVALSWLERAFGFTPKGEPLELEKGMVHAEMAFEDGFLMLGTASEERGASSPQTLPAVHQSLYVYVPDVDAHYRHAVEAGAEPLTEPADMFWGDRMYAVKDLEGHHWSFAQHVRDVALEDLVEQSQGGME